MRRIFEVAAAAPTGPHRHRWGDLRTSSQPRRHGAGLRARLPGPGPFDPVNELWRVPGDASARPRKCRFSRTAPGVAFMGSERWKADCGCNSGMHGGWHQRWRAPLARGAGLVARPNSPPASNEGGKEFFAHPWQRARPLHRGRAGPLARVDRRVLRRQRVASPLSGGADAGSEAAGIAASRHADVSPAAAGFSTSCPASRPCR